MEIIDRWCKLDWSESEYIGDGVYVLDATERQGVPSIALRCDRSEGIDGPSIPMVIVLEPEFFAQVKEKGDKIIAHWNNRR